MFFFIIKTSILNTYFSGNVQEVKEGSVSMNKTVVCVLKLWKKITDSLIVSCLCLLKLHYFPFHF